MRTFASSRVERKSFYRKSELQMFLLISGGHIGGQKYRVSIQRKGAWNVSANNSESVGHKDLRFRQIVYTLVFYNTSFSWLFPLDGFNLFFGAVFIAWPWKTKNTTQCVPRQWRNVPTGEERRLYSTLDAACEVSPFLLMRIVRGEKMEVNGRGGEGEGSLWRRRDRKTVWHLSFHTSLCCTKSYLASYWSIIKVSHDIAVINNAPQADTYRS